MARNLFDLTGRVVLAAGANSGIGLGFLMGCAKQGADVVVWGRRADRNIEALEKLSAAGAGRVHHEPVDVADEAAVQAAFASSLKVMDRVDCVFVNAGFSSRAPSFPDMTTEMYHELLNVNLHGAFYTLREATRHMRERAQTGDPGGSIVVCGSLSIFHGLQGMEHYAGAKGALAAMVKGLAVEMGQYGVRANMIAPGFIMTEMTQGSPQAEGVIKHFSSITPLGRPGYPEDIEGPAAYLASDASRFHTGDILIVDGGRTVKSL
ncbi:SDR family oxidoreductase [Phenylobacterium sp. LjRoot225]|uniref:SDR family NAD(P)-dependent oxidoreductase n=1 Tax=Phenylobacterium sp. LjRoot225 TaxID=3342285 RepID=UPI003ED0ABF4